MFLWDEWPLRDGPDIGIDLVAEMSDDTGLCAIQAKAYDPSYSIKKEDIDSFIAASSPERYKYRLLVATTNRIGAHASRTLQSHSNISLLLRSHIESTPLTWPSTFEELAKGLLPSPRAALKPFDFQTTAVTQTVASLGSKDNRGQLIMPCGTGKTLMAYWILHGLSAQRVLFAAPALSLLRKTLTTWAYQQGHLPAWLAVCSDESIAKGVSSDPTLSSSAEHIYDLSVPVTTAPDRIRAFLSANTDCWVFSTYHSLPAIADAFAAGTAAPFDLAICDEAHRLVGVPTATFGSVLEDARIPCEKRLFMTATAKTYRRALGNKASHIGTRSRDMSDRLVFGDVIHRVGLPEAIEKQWLTDYQVLVLVTDDSGTNSLLSTTTTLVGSRGQPLGRHALAVALATLKAIDTVGIRKIVSFHGSIKKARDFHDALKELHLRVNPSGPSDLIVRHVHGGMSAARREEVLNGFSKLGNDACMIVTNARCLGEGVDIPTLDGIVFADPKNSHIEIVQAVGRVIRASKDKTIATIVIPVVLPARGINDVNEAVQASAFRYVWQVLSAIRSHDSRLGEEIDACAQEYARTGHNSGLPKRLAILNVSQKPLDAASLAAAVSARIYEAVALSDIFGLGKAEKYAALHGTLRGIKTEVVVDDFDLGWWIVRQRGMLRDNSIEPTIKQKLDELGIVWDPLGERWATAYASLQAWIQADDGRTAAQIPNDLTLDGVKISIWLRLQRSEYRHKNLSQERIACLESIGIEWEPHDAKWQRAVDACRQWCEQDRDLSSVINNALVDDYPLGTFISHQRVFYKKGMIPPERIKQLEEFGMVWDKKDAKWTIVFRACQHYVAHVDPISQVNANGPPYRNLAIGRWLHHQRQLAKKRLLRDDRRALLDSIGMNWAPGRTKIRPAKLRDEFAAWQLMLSICDEFVAAHPGHSIKVTTTYKGKRIGAWVRNNLHALRKGQLALERAALLAPRVSSYRSTTRPRS